MPPSRPMRFMRRASQKPSVTAGADATTPPPRAPPPAGGAPHPPAGDGCRSRRAAPSASLPHTLPRGHDMRDIIIGPRPAVIAVAGLAALAIGFGPAAAAHAGGGCPSGCHEPAPPKPQPKPEP